MKSQFISPRLGLVISVILAGAFMRLIPHWPNFTPIAAMALFGGAYISKRYMAFLIPLIAMFVSDLVLGFHANMPAVYVAFALVVILGGLIGKNIKFSTVVGASLISSTLFFLITNFAAWLTTPIYPATFGGLMQAYTAGLMFFNDGSYGVSFFLNEVIGSLFFNGVFFGAFYLIQARFPAFAKA